MFFEERVLFNSMHSGSAGKPIVYEALGTTTINGENQAIPDTAANNLGAGLIQFDDASFITIKGLEITNYKSNSNRQNTYWHTHSRYLT